MINVFGYFPRKITNSLHIIEHTTFLLGHNKVLYLLNATHVDGHCTLTKVSKKLLFITTCPEARNHLNFPLVQ